MLSVLTKDERRDMRTLLHSVMIVSILVLSACSLPTTAEVPNNRRVESHRKSQPNLTPGNPAPCHPACFNPSPGATSAAHFQ